jgi:hypothetical protein
LYNYHYDIEYEKIRKFELEKYLMRSKEKNDEEKKIMEELRSLENTIKREEREQLNLKKILKLDENNDNDVHKHSFNLI